MADKDDERREKVEALRIQVGIAQAVIMAMQKEHGNEKTIAMINTLLESEELEPDQALLLRSLVTGMQAEAMGDAGKTFH